MHGLQTPAQLRNKNRYDDVGTCSVILTSDSVNDTSCARTPTDCSYHISGRVGRHNCVICGSEPPIKHLEHERRSPKVVERCALTQKRVLGPCFFDEDIITSNSLLDMLENNALPQLNKNKNPILQMDGVPVHFSHLLRECYIMKFPGRRIGRGSPCSPDLVNLRLCERLSAKPTS
jgi:hypothetical protein